MTIQVKRGRPKAKIDMKRVEQMIRDGHTLAEIAVEFKVHYNTVWKYKKLYNAAQKAIPRL